MEPVSQLTLEAFIFGRFASKWERRECLEIMILTL